MDKFFVLNALIQQDTSIVFEIVGTTVELAGEEMELLFIGLVLSIGTAGGGNGIGHLRRLKG